MNRRLLLATALSTALPIPAASGIELSFQEIVSGSTVRATLSAAGGDEKVTLRLPR